MMETFKKIAAFALLGYAVLFVLVNVSDGLSALAAVVALTVGLVGGLVHVRRKYGRTAADYR